jgi:serine/threonine protein kinase
MLDGYLGLHNPDSLVKIIDFGASDLIQEFPNGFTSQQGTEGYMAPEVYEKTPYRAESVDMFSLGYCLFEMTVGYSPFKSAHSD